jgi:23S rRNA (uracil1939-C5)-methyltransferase
VEKAKKNFGQARTLEVVEPSPDRIEPVADHPGAPWQVLPYDKQLATKADQVDDALRRIGHLDGFVMEEIVPAAQQWRYRNKLEYSFGEGADGELICGFHAAGRFDQIVPVTDNKLASERGNELREATLAVCREAGLTPWDRRTQRGFLRNLVVREGAATGQFQVRLVTSPGKLPVEELRERVQCDSLWWTQTEGLGETTSGGKSQLLGGAPQLEDRIGELRFLVSPEAFFQTNTPMAGVLYGIAEEYADLHGTERVFDLFCGIGTIALTLAPRARRVIGLELIEDAIQDAAENAKINEITNATFYSGDVRTSMRELVEEVGRPDVVVVDPPRAGLSAKIVRRIVEAAPEKIVYVSCNPTTLAPNAAQLVEAGYVFDRVRPVDLFPQTPHIECVARFTAGPDGVKNPDRD